MPKHKAGSMSATASQDLPVATTIRLILLVGLAALMVPLYLAIGNNAPRFALDLHVSLPPLLGLTALYGGVVGLVLLSRPATDARVRWCELALICLIGLLLRAIFWPHVPTISTDAFRYVWDAQQVAHGVSPYIHTPNDPSIAYLHDKVIWPVVGWRDSPTIYPAGAQIFYLATYLVAPLNIWALKAGIAICDIGTGLLTLVLLQRHGLDLRRVIIYWWCPIPIIEFAFSAHVDAVALLWTLAALVVAGQHWRGARIVAGILLGLAAITKLYPLIFVVALVRRKDWGFLAALVGTIVICYLPFIKLGLGDGGFLGTYFHQQYFDQGILLKWLSRLMLDVLKLPTNVLIVVQILVLGALIASVAWWRWRFGLRPEAAVLALSVTWIVMSPHVFTWYVAALLPLLALYLRVGTSSSRPGEVRPPLDLAGNDPVPAQALWLFVVLMPFSYAIFSEMVSTDLFLLIFLIPAALVAWSIWRRKSYLGFIPAIQATYHDIASLRPADILAILSPKE